MSFFKKVGLATGLLIDDEEPSKGTLPQLSPEEQAEIEAQIDRELANPPRPSATPAPEVTMPPVRRPQARTAGPSISALTPDDIKQIVDGEISEAGQPAYGLYLKLDIQFAGTVPNVAQRAVLVIGAMEATHNFTPANVLWDVDEAVNACEAVQAEIEAGRDDEIASQVENLEADADEKIARATELRAEANRLESEAQAQKAEAAQRRTTITQAVSAALAYIAERVAALGKVRESLTTQNPGLTPVEPLGNVRPE